MFSKEKIQKIIKDIQKKRRELAYEYEKFSMYLREKYEFSFKWGKPQFSKRATQYHKKFKTPLYRYIIPKSYRHVLSMPFIYAMIFPVVILDIFLFIYQQTAMRLYGIPLIKRSEYVVFDRKHLAYLNLIQKGNCIYCSYVNGIFQYAVEIAGRTEKYWCPIKVAQKKSWSHRWEEYFADFWDPEEFKNQFNSNKEFLK